MGRERQFRSFYRKMANVFKEYGLELTLEQSRKEIVMLDVVAYTNNNQLHTKENRDSSKQIPSLYISSPQLYI